MFRPYKQVDVFTQESLRGNPLAVVFEAEGLSDAQMQDFARWVNLSETTFVLPPTDPQADYRVRIFTPGGELPFAGHPTIGTCHAWLQAGGRPRRADEVIQQCGVGRVRVRRGDTLAFAAPPMRAEAVEPGLLSRVREALGLREEQVRAARWLHNGPRFLGLMLDTAASVLAIEPDHAILAGLADVGVIGPHPAGTDAQFEVRCFLPAISVPEDPVTGSLNASLAQWLIGEGLAPTRYVAAQGTRLGRAGRVHIERDGDTLWVGGGAVTVMDGRVSL